MNLPAPRLKLLALGGVALLAVGAVVVTLAAAQGPAPGETDEKPAAELAPPGSTPAAPAVKAPPTPGSPTPGSPTPGSPTPGSNVRIVFKVIPPTKATVTWGKKKLGLIKPKAPLIIQRPRDSGPLDVVVRAEGCLPVHTRAYTFTDTTVAVHVTSVEKKNTVYGYREELPPEPDGGVLPGQEIPDGGTSIGAP